MTEINNSARRISRPPVPRSRSISIPDSCPTSQLSSEQTVGTRETWKKLRKKDETQSLLTQKKRMDQIYDALRKSKIFEEVEIDGGFKVLQSKQVMKENTIATVADPHGDLLSFMGSLVQSGLVYYKKGDYSIINKENGELEHVDHPENLSDIENNNGLILIPTPYVDDRFVGQVISLGDGAEKGPETDATIIFGLALKVKLKESGKGDKLQLTIGNHDISYGPTRKLVLDAIGRGDMTTAVVVGNKDEPTMFSHTTFNGKTVRGLLEYSVLAANGNKGRDTKSDFEVFIAKYKELRQNMLKNVLIFDRNIYTGISTEKAKVIQEMANKYDNLINKTIKLDEELKKQNEELKKLNLNRAKSNYKSKSKELSDKISITENNLRQALEDEKRFEFDPFTRKQICELRDVVGNCLALENSRKRVPRFEQLFGDTYRGVFQNRDRFSNIFCNMIYGHQKQDEQVFCHTDINGRQHSNNDSNRSAKYGRTSLITTTFYSSSVDGGVRKVEPRKHTIIQHVFNRDADKIRFNKNKNYGLEKNNTFHLQGKEVLQVVQPDIREIFEEGEEEHAKLPVSKLVKPRTFNRRFRTALNSDKKHDFDAVAECYVSLERGNSQPVDDITKLRYTVALLKKTESECSKAIKLLNEIKKDREVDAKVKTDIQSAINNSKGLFGHINRKKLSDNLLGGRLGELVRREI